MSAAATLSRPSQSDVLDRSFLELLIDQHESQTLPRLRQLWDYYRNELTPRPKAGGNGRDYRLPQEQGLPPRFGDVVGTYVNNVHAPAQHADG